MNVNQSVEKSPESLDELSVGDALALAVRLHRLGQLDDAETLYRRTLDVTPEQSDALHFLGVLLHQRDQSDSAIDLIRRSIELDPAHADRHNNLGNVLVERGRLAEATEAYQAAIARRPDHADAWNNLGALLRELRRFDEAAVAYQKAIELDPGHVDAYNNYGNLLSRQGRVQEAIAYYCKAITLVPNHRQSRKLLGVAYYTLGKVDAAAEVFRRWLQDEPDNPVAAHLHAACSGRDVPVRASDAYIESTFDDFAATFDAKLERLAYRAPQLIADALAKLCVAHDKQFTALDAGCGTGLCGPLIAPWVQRLVGVDLSSRMLAAARKRDVYDDVVQGELTAYLNDHRNTFDLIVSADTLVYFGQLEAVLDAAFNALRADGLLLFTVEEAADDGNHNDFCINPHGRYSHTREYLRQALATAGFTAIAIDAAILRTEGGKPVAGLVVTGRRDQTDATTSASRTSER
ncbi:MAG: tetratricopeptide repeat protein [Gammaproteobacteria bacterium]